jgi:HD-GYP domain-containing protein (c-di-GMP phosphodiesterase class II)
MTKDLTKKSVTIRFAVVTVFALAAAFIAVLALGLQYYFGNALARDAASDLYESSAAGAARQLIDVRTQTTNMVDLLALHPLLKNMSSLDEQRQLFATVMRQNLLFYGVYIGSDDGRLHELVYLDNGQNVRGSLKAEPEDSWVVITVQGQGENRRRRYDYYSKEFKLRASRDEPTRFDVTTRPWYRSAQSSDTAQTTQIYRFSALQVYGQTSSRAVPNAATVVGIDMTLSGISSYLKDQLSGSSATSFVFDSSGEVFASSMLGQVLEAPRTVPSKQLIKLANDPSRQRQMIDIRLAERPHFAYVTPLPKDNGVQKYFGIVVPRQAVVGALMAKVRLSIAITAAFLFMLLPLSWFFASPIVRPIKQLADENEKIRVREYGRVARVKTTIKEVDELSESMVRMSAAIAEHELQQRTLMDAFIQLIAQAIDDKSAYTGAHCARVPELAFMLAEYASGSEDGPFETFALNTQDQWREYRIAAWLHDCGKITTPEHIVDKGSKLETIYNRIHEVRMRFEVLWRDAEIQYLRQLQGQPEREPELGKLLDDSRLKLREDFDFIAQCNLGAEFFGEEKVSRLLAISERTWQRHFDDRLGLSPVEELRQDSTAAVLPVTEQLLSDKPEHVIKRERSTEYDPALGIKMDVPEHLYNLGELYNLCVGRGTLTAEDRFKINEHMISTIKMLEGLPFPPELKNVPRYASTHHETMKGSGYPRQLPGHALSIPEKILAIADVFEALTASDRPYKKAKSVSVAMDILHKMVVDNHLDKDCFELFVRSKVYLRYAERFLDPQQIDAVDESKYIS